MNDSFAVRRVQRIGNVACETEDLFERQRLTSDPLLQRLAFKELHRDKSSATFLADIINGANIRVIQCRCGLRFSMEALLRCGIRRGRRGKELQCHSAMQPGVLGLVHHTHSADAQLPYNSIVRDDLAWEEVI